MMQAIRQTGVSWRRKWYDVDSNTTAKAVYRKITQAHRKTEQRPAATRYEVDTNTRTWQQHRDQNTSTRTLAVIANSDEKGKVISAINAYNSNVGYFIGATLINSYSTSTGGFMYADNNYIYHQFIEVGTHTLTLTHSINAEYLIVGGGGSGGSGRGGGGGAGAFKSGSFSRSAGTYTIIVGEGGPRAFANSPGNNGGSSSIVGLTSAVGGGGGGGWNSRNGINGGSGGGGSRDGLGGVGTFGSSGASGYTIDGGGGGGASTGGSDKNGGIGLTSSITGTTKYYAGGGGAGGNLSAGVAYGGQYQVRNGTYGGGNGVPYNSSNANTYFWTYNAWTDDASTGLDTNATYTVLVNLGGTDINAARVNVNGVYLQANALDGTFYSIGGEVAYYQGSPTGNISGAGLALAFNFIYGNNRTVTLKNLTPGATYKTSFFSLGFDSDLQIRNQTNIHKCVHSIQVASCYTSH
jgi:hypothetical protein